MISSSLAAGRVVEIPRVAAKEIEDVLERAVGNEDARLVGEAVVEFDAVRQEQAAVEVADFAEQGAGVRAAGGFGLGEAFKEQGLQEDGIEFIGAALPALGEFIREVIAIRAVEEEFFLEKPDEHEAVHQHGRIPAALVVVLDAANEFGELQALDVELAVELFGDALDIEGGL